jgi:hypothetical protein
LVLSPAQERQRCGATGIDDGGVPLGDSGVPLGDSGVPLGDSGVPLGDSGVRPSVVPDVSRIPSTAPVPNANELPLTCEFLNGDNCWKQIARAATACAPQAKGKGAVDRKTCDYPDGSRLTWGGSMPTYAASDSSIYFSSGSFLADAQGRACMTVYVAPSKTALEAGGKTVLLENIGITNWRLTCPDGKTYSTTQTGSCADYGAYFSQGKAPNLNPLCIPSKSVCTNALQGTEAGRVDVASCEP